MAIETTIQEPDTVGLDWLILGIALAIGLFSTGGLVVSIWLSLNIYLLTIIDNSSGWTYWTTMSDWAMYFYLKDFALILLAGVMRISPIVLIGLMVSVIFHIFISWQINTHDWENVTLLEYRSELMEYLSVIMLASVANIGSGSNGGRRVRNTLLHWNDMRYNFLYSTGYKVRA